MLYPPYAPQDELLLLLLRAGTMVLLRFTEPLRCFVQLSELAFGSGPACGAVQLLLLLLLLLLRLLLLNQAMHLCKDCV